MFKIELLLNTISKKKNNISCKGKIIIDSFSESFICPLNYWSEKDYYEHWYTGIRKIIKENKSALITEMHNPLTSNFIIWWVLYKLEDIVYIQNKILFIKELNQTFDIKNFSDYIEDRKIYTEEGDKISEWKININEFINFFNINYK